MSHYRERFDRDDYMPAPEEFQPYRKTAITRAARIAGPFTVVTREGTLTCQDGYLAVDSDGWPYPIAAEVFEATYVAAEDES